MAIGQELLNIPFSEMVTSMGQAISQAQLQLDTTTLKIAQIMAGNEYDTDVTNPDGSKGKKLLVEFGEDANGTPIQLSMLELGFTPSFYHFVDTIIEVKVSITISNEISSSLSTFQGSFNSYFALFAAGASCSSVSASYAGKYNYSAEGSSLLRTKIQPVPPPAIFEQRLKALLAARS
jgi:hypothetical protein